MWICVLAVIGSDCPIFHVFWNETVVNRKDSFGFALVVDLELFSLIFQMIFVLGLGFWIGQFEPDADSHDSGLCNHFQWKEAKLRRYLSPVWRFEAVSLILGFELSLVRQFHSFLSSSGSNWWKTFEFSSSSSLLGSDPSNSSPSSSQFLESVIAQDLLLMVTNSVLELQREDSMMMIQSWISENPQKLHWNCLNCDFGNLGFVNCSWWIFCFDPNWIRERKFFCFWWCGVLSVDLLALCTVTGLL